MVAAVVCFMEWHHTVLPDVTTATTTLESTPIWQKFRHDDNKQQERMVPWLSCIDKLHRVDKGCNGA